MLTPIAIASAQVLRTLADKIETGELVVTRFLAQVLSDEDPYTMTSKAERLEIDVVKNLNKSSC